MIRYDWKDGLIQLLSRKLLNSFGLSDKDDVEVIPKVSGKIVNFLAESITMFKNKVSLDPAKKLIIEKILKSRKITIYLDDLDRGWEGNRLDIKRISALLNAIRDLSSDNPGLLFRIALRSDVYFLVRTSDESTDKIEGSVIWYSWTNHEILVLLIKRIETFFGISVDDRFLLETKQHLIAYFLESIIEQRFTGRGHWANAPMYRILMSLIRKRPIDLVKLCTAAARKAYLDNSQIILTSHFESVFEDYSQGRVQDTINEYRSELPDIDRLIMGMKPNKKEKTAKQDYCFTTDQLLKKINNIMQSWSFSFTSRKGTADKKDLANFLYKINFLTARKELAGGDIQRKYFEENRYLSSKFADFGYDWRYIPPIDGHYSRIHFTIYLQQLAFRRTDLQ